MHAAPAAYENVDVDARILALAARQHGVVARGQLVAAGIPSHRIDYRIRRGRLRRLHYGVGLEGVRARDRAAVLACGDAAVLSHHSAAAARGILPERPVGYRVDVSLRQGNRTHRRGIRVHRPCDLRTDEVDTHDAIPTTTPERTLLDLANVGATRELEGALARALRAELTTLAAVERTLRRHTRRPGSASLRALVAAANAPAFTRSEAEAEFLALMRRAELPVPEVNVVVQGFEVDFLWRERRLVVEVDGYAFHRSRLAFERDSRRVGFLTAAGLRVIPVTWRQITTTSAAVVAKVAAALAVGGAPDMAHGPERPPRKRGSTARRAAEPPLLS